MIVNVGCGARYCSSDWQSGAPIWVHHRVDYHDHIIEHRGHFAVGAGYEVVDARECRIGARGLVAMNRVSHPRHRGECLDDGVGFAIANISRIGKARDLRFNLIEPG